MQRTVLLIISGSIAAYKSLDLIRRLREKNIAVNVILTRGGAEFITPLSVASLTGTPVYSELFSLKDETEMGHIRLSREADLVVVAPASADMLAKMVAGRADDLATAALLATDKKVMVVPAMNAHMWSHKATQRNITRLKEDGIQFIEPESGALACGEIGAGRLAEVDTILKAIVTELEGKRPLSGKTAIVTSGPTFEPIDPVRFIGNRSSGKQGHAIAAALAHEGANVTLITGPVTLPDPEGVTAVHVETAEQMLAACMTALPADIAVFASAVADWRIEKPMGEKIKKRADHAAPTIKLVENPDILFTVATHAKRPALVIGFAAETETLAENAAKKRIAKRCDWILANDVTEGVYGEEENHVLLVTPEGSEDWPRMGKREVARKLALRIASHLSTPRLRKVK